MQAWRCVPLGWVPGGLAGAPCPTLLLWKMPHRLGGGARARLHTGWGCPRCEPSLQMPPLGTLRPHTKKPHPQDRETAVPPTLPSRVPTLVSAHRALRALLDFQPLSPKTKEPDSHPSPSLSLRPRTSGFSNPRDNTRKFARPPPTPCLHPSFKQPRWDRFDLSFFFSPIPFLFLIFFLSFS